MRLLALLVLMLGGISFLFAQEQGEKEEEVIITLNNSSFEDIRRNSHPPAGWYDCGFINETPPDVQPGSFGVMQDPKDGMSYLGMVVRDNETWEAVAQELSQPLINGNCYSFTIALCRSEFYLSPSRSSQNLGKETNYLTPVKLKVWGGNNYCDKSVLLAESILVKNYRWIDYTLKLEADGNMDQYTHLILEAYYKTPSPFPYNGNLLLDDASDLKLVPCDETPEPPVEEVIAETPVQEFEAPENTPPVEEVVKDEPEETTPPEEKNTDTTSEEPKKEPSLAGFKKSELKKGQIIRMDKLFFEADKAEIKKASDEILTEVYVFLEENKDVIVEIGGHTNDIPPHNYCDSLSTERARAVAEYLSKKGIEKRRLQYKGYGKRKPLFSNRTEYGRRRNQRVEIKVLDFEN